MKTVKIAILAASLATLATSAFATDFNVADREAYLRQLSGQPAVQTQTIVEGRQAAHVNVAPSTNDQLLIDLANARNNTNH